MAERQGDFAAAEPSEELPAGMPDPAIYPSPALISREVVASSVAAESFGWAQAWHRGFPAAERQAFVADVVQVNWTIQRCPFSRATPIPDLMHSLSYAFTAAPAMSEPDVYRRWAEWIWKDEVDKVLAVLETRQQQIGQPPTDVEPADLRFRIARALTY